MATDDRIRPYLLQLVQLMRYEPWAEASSCNSRDAALPQQPPATGPHMLPMSMPPLAQFLIDRACGSLDLANALLWLLTAEMYAGQAFG